MTSYLRQLVLLAFLASPTAWAADAPEVRTYEEALDLIHAYSGSGDELVRVARLIDQLSRTAPKSGYAESLVAEGLSTWRLSQSGGPPEVFDEVIATADRALQLDPRLAQPHAAKARAYVRSSRYAQANASIDAALALDPKLSGALFLRAEIHRRNGAIDEATLWYGRFIDSTSNATRKSNGHHWIGRTYHDAALYGAAPDDFVRRSALMAQARSAYERSMALSSGGAWPHVNFAVFLNDAADYDAAERHALKALEYMEFPMARFHLAAARYQRLLAGSFGAKPSGLSEAAKAVADSTGVSLSNAMSFSAFSYLVKGRLQLLRERLP